MALSNIQTADPTALGCLLNETIFGIAEARPDGGVDHETESPHFVFYGENKRRYLFLVEDRHHEWMSAPALDAFSRTLAALKLSVGDIALLNLARLPEVPKKTQLTAFFQPRAVVLLGAPPAVFGLDPGVSGQVVDSDGLPVLRTAAFDELLTNDEKKRQFWTAIKQLLV
ncbi:hypothetical protein [Parapedobacter lycopersici]|uniref:hypothetical protein n=1 Tax=Parapedobacter lycopersici TaxID=1864939 RepID=UPI00214D8A57|nr:hypothetical protein [Parapedobacter lycopersici]